MLQQLVENISHNLFKPLLLFFYAGFLIPILGVKFEFPKQVYQGLTMFLLLAIGWHGGEQLAELPGNQLTQALGFMAIGFFTNLIIGMIAYGVLRAATKLRRIDAATVAGYYGSDSAGTFVTATGVLIASSIAYAPYMPVMLAVMEIPGCLVALFLISRLRSEGMDARGNMPGEEGFRGAVHEDKIDTSLLHEKVEGVEEERELVGAATTSAHSNGAPRFRGAPPRRPASGGHLPEEPSLEEEIEAEDFEAQMALESPVKHQRPSAHKQRKGAVFSKELLHEVFFNPGIYLLFAGIAIGFIGQMQGKEVVKDGNALFNTLFQSLLYIFLLEMGITASSRLKDLKTAGWQFIAFGLIAPNVFATIGMCIAHGYSLYMGQPFAVGTYVLFAVLCGAASYIAVPAVQRMAIPEASPTLPLAASLGLTFSYNVTIGIPVYMMIATALTTQFPIHAAG